MKIAQLVHNLHPVKPESGQAIYSTVNNLADGLAERNNEVTLFAAGNSVTKAHLVSVTEGDVQSLNLKDNEIKNYYHRLATRCYTDAAKFDIIHSHFSLISSFYAQLVNTPTIISLHSSFTPGSKKDLAWFKDNYYVAFSGAQRLQAPQLNWVGTIYHGVDTQKFNFNPIPKDYFLYIGRITEDKGVHLAIEAAKAAGVKLVIAGPSYPQEPYWQTHIQKWIDDDNVRYIGSVNFETKIKYYQNAKALLFPTQLAETFGMVMIEAMACGTPVIGWDNGSVSEIIQHKETGYVVKRVEDMVKAIQNIDKINREATRQRALKLFSIDKMVTGYEKVYMRVIEDYRSRNKNK